VHLRTNGRSQPTGAVMMVGSTQPAMDIETAEAIEHLGRRIDATEASLLAELGAVRDELRTEIRAVRDDLRAEFRDGLAENRRHSEILSESLRDDIRILAEGFATLSAKLDSRHH